MGKIAFTPEQQAVIDHPTKNILVSAAAGSGKTAVLVQRVMRMTIEAETPVDIDRILVVTFTRNAAAQMKEKIYQELEKRHRDNPGDDRLKRQMNLIHYANIMTIDAFCKSIVQNYFQEADVDPNFKGGDEAEMKALWSEAIGEALEAAHGNKTEAFGQLLAGYAGKRSDKAVEELATKLHRFADSAPFPELWLKEAYARFAANAQSTDSDLWQMLLSFLKSYARDCVLQLERAIAISSEENGPAKYIDLFTQELSMLRQLCDCDTYSAYADVLSRVSFGRLPKVSEQQADVKLRDRAKNLRDKVKDTIKKIKADYFFAPEETLLSDMQAAKPAMQALIALVLDARERYLSLCQEKAMYSFSDIAHLALRILVEPQEDGSVRRKEPALRYSKQFEEIMIDEYQDSNLVQDLLLTAISRTEEGMPNVFVVGDVKQSIYKFRMARPELFMEKYRRYSGTEAAGEVCMDLTRNFRSRSGVLTGINEIFKRIMTEPLGGVVYDQKAALYPGLTYPALPSGRHEKPELWVFCPPKEQWSDVMQRRRLISETLVSQLQRLVGPDGAWVTDGGVLRPAEYGDIVILFRGLTGNARKLAQDLNRAGIDTVISSNDGFFETIEVRTVLNVLRVLDNPFLDVPVAAVLHSPVIGLNEAELAAVAVYEKKHRSGEERQYLFQTVQQLVLDPYAPEDALKGKCRRFLALVEKLRQKQYIVSTEQLLQAFYEESGYLLYVWAMPGGDARKANLDVLLEKAREFSSFSGTSLSDFLRYLERLQEYGSKIKDGNIVESSNAVRFMTIHASKGLEFPIVLVAELEREFNQKELDENFLLHQDYGLGPTVFFPETRTKQASIARVALRQRLLLDGLGEELRILYTALTRAREKLILVGFFPEWKKNLDDYEEEMEPDGCPIGFRTLVTAKRYADWVIPAILSADARLGIHPDQLQGDGCYEGELYQVVVRSTSEASGNAPDEPTEGEVAGKPDDLDGKPAEGAVAAASDCPGSKSTEAAVGGLAASFQEDDAREVARKVRQVLTEYEQFQYPFAKSGELPVKLTVSEVKQQWQQAREDDETEPYLYTEPSADEEAMPVPSFLREAEAVPVSGVSRGSLYHRALELHDYSLSMETEPEVAAELRQMVAEQKLEAKACDVLSARELLRFYQSDMGRRMHAASLKGQLFLEQGFVMSVPAKVIDPEVESEEPVLIQGVIDAYFEEEGEIVLLDYKTDRVDFLTGEADLKERYAIQLQLYASALQRATGKNVKERCIYSLTLQKIIPV